MSERNRCYIYFKWLKSIDRLTDEQLGQFFRAYYVMQITGDTTLEVDDPMVNMMLDQTREQVAVDIAKYEETCERNRNNGMNGGRPKTQNNPVGFSETQSDILKPTHNPKKPDKDKEIDKEIEVDVDKDSPSENNNPPVLPNGNTVPPSGGGRKKPAPKAVYSPDPALDDAIHEFVKHRKAMRKPMTDKAIELFINKLNKLAPGDNDKQIRLINTAIEHGWQSVYEDKQQSNVVGMTAGQRLNKEQNDVLKAVYQGLI